MVYLLHVPVNRCCAESDGVRGVLNRARRWTLFAMNTDSGRDWRQTISSRDWGWTVGHRVACHRQASVLQPWGNCFVDSFDIRIPFKWTSPLQVGYVTVCNVSLWMFYGLGPVILANYRRCRCSSANGFSKDFCKSHTRNLKIHSNTTKVFHNIIKCNT